MPVVSQRRLLSSSVAGRFRPLLWALVFVLLSGETGHAQVAVADDVCSPTADPCIVDRTIDVADGAVLDFGGRTVEIRNNGQFIIGSGVAWIRCGAFRTLVGGSRVIDLRGPLVGGGSSGGTLILEVRGQCELDPSRGCLRSLDCDLGSCLSGACTNDSSVVCTVDSDCNMGTCLAAGAVVSIDGKIRASADDPGSITVQAAGDVVISAPVTASGLTQDSDGGAIDVSSEMGSVEIASPLEANSGIFGLGGSVALSAAVNLMVSADVVANGGDIGGDTIDLWGGNDVTISALVSSTASAAAGDGGDVMVLAGRDVLLLAPGEIRASGHADVYATAGSGGSIAIDAGRYVRIGDGARITAKGALPDGDGGYLDMTAGGDVTIEGRIDVGARSLSGAGGEVVVDGCGVFMTATAVVDAAGDFGSNALIGHDVVEVALGAQLGADAGSGQNSVEYGRVEVPPVLAGTIVPAAEVIFNPLLSACATCGNGRVEVGETCDDGNTSGGDGCSGDCQDEGCIAGTPGYPAVPLCDDGEVCSADSCDTAAHACVHLSPCDDGIACTVDTCQGGQCFHTADDGRCDDGNPCTRGSCDPALGCVQVPVSATCDDGVFCNGDDTCAGGSCSVHSGDPCAMGSECADRCDEVGRTCLSPAGYPCHEDGDPCTDDLCDGAGGCTHPPGNGPCDDGLFCNGPDHCSAGSCIVHDGDPCLGGGQCRDLCDEGLDACLAPAGSPCTDDGNPCTDDTCDGAGSCLHTPGTGPCDDGDPCTTDDQCVDGACRGVGESSFSTTKIQARSRAGVEKDKMRMKALVLGSVAGLDPAASGVIFQLRGRRGEPIYEATLPASAWVNAAGRGRSFRYRDSGGTRSGVRRAVVKVRPDKGWVRFSLVAGHVELEPVATQASMSVSVVFGQPAQNDACYSAIALACRQVGIKAVCE